MFTPTAEKLMPDLTPREELVVLARALWREGYNDHLAGHITVNLGDGTLLCNPWLLTWAELRPSQVLRIDLDGQVVEGDWPVPLGIPLHLELHKAARRTWAGRCTTTRSSARCGPTWARCPRSWTRARRSAAAPLVLVDEYEGPVNDASSARSGGRADGRRGHGAAGRARRLRAGRLGPGRAPTGGGAGAALPARLVRPGGRRRGSTSGPAGLHRPGRGGATARASSASGRRRYAPSWWPTPVCSALTRPIGERSRRPRSAPSAPGCRAARRCTTTARGRAASARTTWRGGSGRAAGGRRTPRTPPRAATAPTSCPCRRSSGWCPRVPGRRPAPRPSPAQGWSCRAFFR